MSSVPFLTQLDSRAQVKGSRDPLGIQSIWTRFGRHVVGNLTTVSTSVPDFTTLILGYHLVQEVADRHGPGNEVETFLRWEQICAYARCRLLEDTAVRGVERVKRTLNEGGNVTISAARSHQILSNQRTYGLWGLYSAPAAASGLVESSAPRLTAAARDFVSSFFEPLLRKSGVELEAIATCVASDRARFKVDPGNAIVAGAVAVCARRLRAPAARFYRDHLLYGGPSDRTGGLQRALAELFSDQRLARESMSLGLVGDLAKAARSCPRPDLAVRLDRIRVCESVVAPASMIFAHMLGAGGRTVTELAHRIRDRVGSGIKTISMVDVQSIAAEMGGADEAAGFRWLEIARTMNAGRFEETIELLIDQNQAVMVGRGGAGWLEMARGRLSARIVDESGVLPSADALLTLWRFPYFLDSLRIMRAQLQSVD